MNVDLPGGRSCLTVYVAHGQAPSHHAGGRTACAWGTGVDMRDWCLGARTLFGEERGDKMHDFQQRLTGHACPCVYANPCPILPAPSDDGARWDDAVAAMDSVTPQALLLRILD